MKDKIDLSIIIVSWNVKDLLLKCLGSIFNNQGNLNLEVFVVDNASNDDTVEGIKGILNGHTRDTNYGKEITEIKKLEIKGVDFEIIENKKNLGFAKANNQGIKQARGEFILLLNPDTEIKIGTLETMVKFMREHQECGITGCRLLNPDGTIQPSIRRFPDFWSQVMILLKLHHLFPNAWPIKKYFVKDFDYSKIQSVEQVMGAFFMIKREVIEKIGMLDENFFIWFEEVDFCKRTIEAGWKVYYVSEAKIIHHGAQSFKQVLNLKKQKMFNKSQLYYFKKHQPCWQWLGLWLLQPVSLALTGIIQVCTKRSNKAIK